ncbi:MAG TPA: four helix bundle protein [Vicinamibacterales bacterium]|nr:four helix bundle protein [Vicinamibacterales bacterium]
MLADPTGMSKPMKKLDDVEAYQLAVDFKRRIYKLVEAHPRARRDYQYVDQLFDAAGGVDSKIAEGWGRFAAAEIRQFLRFALGSLEEAKRWVVDGIDRGYFTREECEELLTIGNRCGAATMAWWRSLGPYVRGPRERPRRNKPRRPGDTPPR